MLEELGQTTMLSIRYKLVFIGNYSVGKTSIIKRILENTYNDKYESTIGVDYYTKNIGYKGTIFKCQIWDTAGQERYKSLIPAYLRNASLIFIVYDIMKESSLSDVENWIKFVKNYIQVNQTKIILIGNKIDLGRKITYEQGSEFAKKENIKFFETSAKTNEGLLNMFYTGISLLDFFDDIRNANNNLTNDLITENEGDRSKIVISSKGEIKEIQNEIQEKEKEKKPELNVTNAEGNQKKENIQKKKCNC